MNDRVNHAKSRFRTPVKAVLSLLVLAGLLWSFYNFIPLLKYLKGDRPMEEFAHYGETFVIWHSLFDTLAFFVIGLTLILEFFEARRGEAKYESQRAQSLFFSYLGFFNSHVNNLECGSVRGRSIFLAWNNARKNILEEERKSSGNAPLADRVFEKLRSQYDPHISHYFRHLFALQTLISIAPERDRETYRHLLRAELSGDEEEILKAYSETKAGEAFRYLVHALRLTLQPPGSTTPAPVFTAPPAAE